MAKQFFENTSKSPRTFYGVTLQPGEQKWIDVPSGSASPPTTYPVTQDPVSKKFYGPDGQELTLVSGGGNAPGSRLALVGDSFAFNANGGAVSGLTLTRANGVVTVTGHANHPYYPGYPISVMGCANIADEVTRTPVLQRLSASSYTYASAGADGVIAAGGQNISVQAPFVQQVAGFWSHFNRLTNGAYRLVANCGIAGATTNTIAARVSSVLGAARPDRVVGIAGYNDINGDTRTLAQTVDAWVAMVAAYPSALWDIFATSPWNAGAAADSAVHLRQLTRYYAALKTAFASNPRVRIHNTPALLANAATGYAITGMVKSSDNIHLAWRGFYTLAKYLAALDVSGVQTGVDLPVTALDTIANDAASKNVIDNPLMAGAVAVAGVVTAGGAATRSGTLPTGWSGAVTSTGATDFAFSSAARADGFGNDIVVTYTPVDAVPNTTALSRLSYAMAPARFASGALIDSIVAKVSVSPIVAGNIKTVNMVLVWDSVDGATYAASVQEASADAQASVSYVQQDDMVDVTLCIRDVVVPSYAIVPGTARLDFTVTHYGTGTAVTVKVGRVQVKLA